MSNKRAQGTLSKRGEKKLTAKNQKKWPSQTPVHGKTQEEPARPFSEFMDLTEEDFRAQIARRAHELYEHRGWAHGFDLYDWLEAERQIIGEGGEHDRRHS